MNLLVGVIGRAGSGKSTFVDVVAGVDGISTAHPGRACRKRYGAGVFSKAENPAAPTFSDEFVLGTIFGAIGQRENTIVIDGYPRAHRQVAEFKGVAELYGMTPIVIAVDTPIDMIYERTGKRDKSKEDIELTKKRLEEDDSLISMILDVCDEGDIDQFTVNNDFDSIEEYTQFILGYMYEIMKEQ